MNDKVKKEVENLIKYYNFSCSIEEFRDKVDWRNISTYHNLSEKFIKEFQDKVDWCRISIWQFLSNNFIKEFQNKLDLETLLENNEITQEFYNYLKNIKVREKRVRRYEILDI